MRAYALRLSRAWPQVKRCSTLLASAGGAASSLLAAEVAKPMHLKAVLEELLARVEKLSALVAASTSRRISSRKHHSSARSIAAASTPRLPVSSRIDGESERDGRAQSGGTGVGELGSRNEPDPMDRIRPVRERLGESEAQPTARVLAGCWARARTPRMTPASAAFSMRVRAPLRRLLLYITNLPAVRVIMQRYRSPVMYT